MSFLVALSTPWQSLVEADGLVQSGSVAALVDRLSRPWTGRDPMTAIDREKTFQDVFLMTFRTFTTAEELSQMLIARYRTPCPQNLPSQDAEEWKKIQVQTQRRILTVFSALWQGKMLLPTEKHSITKPLEDFLGQVLEPPLIRTAQFITTNVKSEEIFGLRMEEACDIDGEAPINAKNYLSKPNISHIAGQLTLLEFDLFCKITPQECIPSATQAENLHNFCGSYDKFVAWIKTSILSEKRVGQRAAMLSFWIEVAELEGLKCTWSCVPSKSQSLLNDMNPLNDPGGGFSKYRSLVEKAEGPCVPFIAMYLTDLARISHQFDDQDGNISFLKRQQWYRVVKTMLHSQTQSYDRISEDRSTLRFISDCLAKAPVAGNRVIRDWYNCALQSELEYCKNVVLLGGDPPLNDADIARTESFMRCDL
ncbi:ras guanine nucleotide exchange factor domain-containing protein [Mycena galericulata]|nr:ras guanine nucleotide exchange factor domain-containing protein [Mycena galericulata]